YPHMEAPAIGRVVALDSGLPVTVPGRQVDRRCGSGLQAVLDGMGAISTGGAQVVVAGGAESMSRAPFFNEDIRWGIRGGNVELKDGLVRGRLTAGGKNHPVPGGMIETAENLREEYSIGREEQDRLAVESHRRATAATDSGVFAEEIVPITIPATRKQPEQQITLDEHIRPTADLESLGRLKAMRAKIDENSTVTPGNASGQNDGAAATIVTTRAKAEELGLKPLVRIVSWGVAGVPPRTMGIGPVPATEVALDRAGLGIKDLDLIELNEAFAAQALAVTREWGFGESDFERTNVHGSGISLGHPVGATGVRILTTLAREMDRRGARYGLETMCIGGGQG
ncbi:MAG TPA: acetyl-CoA C-acetyltransferase, partial [Brevibacterium sp.]|nr:acetyl-CoA C-acetyltransferase [Brevibacterium sp.]